MLRHTTYVDHFVSWDAVQATLNRSEDHWIVDAKEPNKLIAGPDPITQVQVVCDSNVIAICEKKSAW
jgi:hypothetical protein